MPADERCLDDDELSAWLSGALDGPERDRASAHVERCEPCRSLLAQCALEPEPELARGDSLGRYVVLERVGAGAMGVVYAAYDPRLDRKVALKVHRSVDPADAERTTAEARALARCAHRNVVSVHDVGAHGDRVFIAMELIEGATLDAWARGRSWRATLAALIDAGEGLAAAHRARVIHRDFKPQNVIVAGDGRVCVTDFGLARLDRAAAPSSPVDSSPILRTGLAGTPLYMAPELFDGAVADERTDQWAFAVTAWELLFGRRPFEGATLDALLRALRQQAPRGDRGAVSPAVRAALVRALALLPNERFASMRALVDALSRATRRRSRWALGAAGALLALGGAAAIASGRARHSACPLGGATFDSAWTPAAQSAIRSVFLQDDPSGGAARFEGTSRILRAWGDRFERARGAACAAFDERGALEPRRLACLEQRLAVTRAFVRALHDGADRERVLSAAAALPEVDDCGLADARGRALAPLSAQARAREGALAARHVELLARRLTAPDESLSDRAEQLRADAAAVGHWPLASRAAAMVSEVSSSRAAAIDALSYAARASDAEAVADGWLTLLRNAARFSNESDLSLASAMAETSIAQLGGDARREGARLRLLCSALEHRARDIAAARAVCLRAQRTLRSSGGDPRALLAEVESALGMLSMHEREHDAALRAFDRALAQASELWGPRSSARMGALNNRCEALVALRRYDEAEQGYLGILAIEPTHAGALDGLAKVRVAQGRAAEALSLAERALAVVRAARWTFAERLVLATVAEARCANAEPSLATSAASRARALDGELAADVDARLRAVERRASAGQCVRR